MKHAWTKVSAGLDACACGLWRRRFLNAPSTYADRRDAPSHAWRPSAGSCTRAPSAETEAIRRAFASDPILEVCPACGFLACQHRGEARECPRGDEPTFEAMLSELAAWLAFLAGETDEIPGRGGARARRSARRAS